MLIREEAFGPVIDPFYGPTNIAGCMQHANIFRIDERLHPERAADIVGHNAKFFRWNPHDLAELRAQHHDALTAETKSPSVLLTREARDSPARLHGVDDDAVVNESQVGDMGSALKSRRDLSSITVMIIKNDIARHAVVEKRRTRLCSLLGIDNRGQRIEINHDGFGSLPRLHKGLRDNE